MTLIPFDDRDGWIWLDGSLIPWRDAKLHVLSHGLHYASAVFEGERAYGGNIFRLSDHSRRLVESGRILRFEIPYSIEAIDEACRQVLAANDLAEGYVRPIAWRGSEQLAVSATGTSVHLAIAAWPWPSYFGGARMQGIRVAQAEWRRPPPDCAPVKAKAAGLYMIGSLAKVKAEAEGYADALMLDWRGLVSETTGANIFLVIDGELHTPDPDAFLDGITRRSVISLAKRNQMKVVERQIQPSDLARATEVFLTGTAAEVTAVREIGPHTYTPGRMTETLMQAYDDLVLQSPETVASMIG
ncbi:MAG TPA: branched-chain amino acid aminotransferase [Rhodopila sp.]|uniref:branched-chain amino acid aminotransferase n=1 Tax=Rhodopila sp. TaxID=2480087 RepID=UPI002D18C6E8|nr:branched-chain amino acid aminotransferase [Rhodopila sp.]HVY15313.1 branched-chain amino acid aminotransferase [Rhodopila sp.]